MRIGRAAGVGDSQPAASQPARVRMERRRRMGDVCQGQSWRRLCAHICSHLAHIAAAVWCVPGRLIRLRQNSVKLGSWRPFAWARAGAGRRAGCGGTGGQPWRPWRLGAPEAVHVPHANCRADVSSLFCPPSSPSQRPTWLAPFLGRQITGEPVLTPPDGCCRHPLMPGTASAVKPAGNLLSWSLTGSLR
jgi:hypothetical protein